VRRSPDRRAQWARNLLLAGIVLLASIEAGRMLGYRILAKAVEQSPVLPAVRYTPRPETSLPPIHVRSWKSDQIVRVAPDPHFPDPRITPSTPPPPPTPRPTRPPARTAPPATLPPPPPTAAPEGEIAPPAVTPTTPAGP